MHKFVLAGKLLISSAWKRALRFTLVLCCVGLSAGCSGSPALTTANQPQIRATAVSHPFHALVKTLDDEYSITLDITPNHVGLNIFTAQVMDNRTGKSAAYIDITLYTTMQDMPMGTDSIVLHTDSHGLSSTASRILNMGGHWAIGITLQGSSHIIHKAGVSLVIS